LGGYAPSPGRITAQLRLRWTEPPKDHFAQAGENQKTSPLEGRSNNKNSSGMPPINLDDLKKIIALNELPDHHLQWILDHSEYREFADGDIIGKYGEEAQVMWMALEGKVDFYMYLNGRQVHYFTFENNNITGGVGGLLPYSRMKTYPGYSYATGDVKMLTIHKRHFQELERLNPDFIQKLIGYMTQRARAFATTQLQHEKVNALGNLAAGIAHELNNPAAAIRSNAAELSERIQVAPLLTKNLLEINLPAGQVQQILSLVRMKENSPPPQSGQTTLQRMQREEDLATWLAERGILNGEAAETFAEFGFTTEELETLQDGLENESFKSVVPWVENLVRSNKIIKDLADAATRISHLVASIKSHVNMDRTMELQPTNIHHDLENTLTLLGFKLREKNIEVIKKFSPAVGEIPAYVGELNQVWTNLIDNAIYALPKNGKLTIETSKDDKNVTVRIMDNGLGIPTEILSRIFDPFFTTKKVGDGTGIGLDIVNRVVKGHDGTIKVDSGPGQTVFSVCLPITH
jgi:signal transduction histidine kinase